MKTVRIFISSPGDVAEEREKTREVIKQLQKRYVGHLNLVPVLWEDLPLGADMSFQEGIDLVVSEEQGIDIAVFILWSRLGSKLGSAIKKIDGSAYRSGTERELDMMLQARAASAGKKPDILAYVRDDMQAFEDRLRGKDVSELKILVNQKEMVQSFIQEYFHDEESGTNIRAYHSFNEPLTFAHRLRVHLQGLLDQYIANDGGNLARWEGAPFRGLEVFDIEHSDIFFGREQEICDLSLKLNEQAKSGCAFVLVAGASGSGKSSLVRAGLIPAIVKNNLSPELGTWRHAILAPGDCAENLMEGLVRSLTAENALPELLMNHECFLELVQGLEKDPELTCKLRIRTALKSDGKNKPKRLLLYIDQLEEIFTHTAISADDIGLFFKALNVLARSGDIHLVATVRSDFYSQCQTIPQLMEMKGDNGVFDLLPPETSSIQKIITKPAFMAGLRFEKDSETHKSLDQEILNDAVGHPEALPLLEYTLRELYERRTEDGCLTFAEYRNLGGVEGALGARAEAVYNELPESVSAALPQVLHELVTVSGDEIGSGVRRRTLLRTVTDTPEKEALTQAFIAERLFISDNDSDTGAVIHVAHEALLRSWPRAAQWIEANREFLKVRERLTVDCDLWNGEEQADDFLIREGKPLAEAEEILEEYHNSLSSELITYIEKSKERVHSQAQRRLRRLKITAAAFALLSVIAVFGAIKANVAAKLERMQVRLNDYNVRVEVLQDGKSKKDTIDVLFDRAPFALAEQEKPVHFIPSFEYSCRWVDDKHLEIIPQKGYAGKTQYSASVKPDLTNVIHEKTFHFTSPTTEVVEFFGMRQSENNAVLRLYINSLINVDEFKQYVTIVDENENTHSYTLSKEDDGTTIKLVLDSLDADQRYFSFRVKKQYRAIEELDSYRVKAPWYDLSETETTDYKVYRDTMTLIQLAEESGIPEATLRLVNPDLKSGMLRKDMVLKVPRITDEELILLEDNPLKLTRASFVDSRGRWSLVVNSNYSVALDSVLDYIEMTPEVENLSVRYDEEGQLVIDGDFKPLTQYKASFIEGMVARNSRTLGNGCYIELTTGQLDSILEFATDGLFMPSDRGGVLPLRICNTREVKFSIARVYVNNYLPFYRDRAYIDNEYDEDSNAYFSEHARLNKLHGEESEIQRWFPRVEREKCTIVNMPIGDYMKGKPQGFYKVTLHDSETGESQYRVLLISDIALHSVVQDKKIAVWCKSLRDGTALSGAEIDVYSSNNQVITSGKSDDQGLVQLNVPVGKQPYMLLARSGDDVTILGLDKHNRHSLSELNSDGRAYSNHAYDAYVYTERGIYAPGETMHLSAVVKNAELAGAGELPVEVRIVNSDGNTLLVKTTESLNADGILEMSYTIPVDTRLGHYTAKLSLPGENLVWGSTDFRINYFEPDRIKLKVLSDRREYQAGERVLVDINADYYFGEPAALNDLDLELFYYDRPYTNEKYKGYLFGATQKRENLYHKSFEGKTNEDGSFKHDFAVESDLTCQGQGEVMLKASMTQDTGHTVTAYRKLVVNLKDSHFGLKYDADARVVKWLNLDAHGDKAFAEELRYDLIRIGWKRLMKQDSSGNLVWEWVSRETVVDSGGISQDGLDQEGDISLDRHAGGHYIIKVFDSSDETAAVLRFNHQRGNDLIQNSKLSHLNVQAAQSQFTRGSKGGVVVECPASGEVCIALVDNQIRDVVVHKVEKGLTTLNFDLPDCSFGSLYAAVTFLRTDKNESRLPRRLFGICQLDIDQSENMIPLAISVAGKRRGESEIKVHVDIEDADDNTVTQVQLYAVDEGILQLTNYQTPDPFEHFYGDRSLNAEFYDLYDQLFPDVDMGLVSKVGGDWGEALRGIGRRKLSQNSAVIVKKFTAFKGKRGTFTLSLPAFSGELRLIAVAVRGNELGTEDYSLTVRKDITLEVATPQVVAPGDVFDVTAKAFNHSEKQDQARLSVAVDGAAAAYGAEDHTLQIKQTFADTAVFKVKVADNSSGELKVTVRLKIGDVVTSQEKVLEIRPAESRVSKNKLYHIKPNSKQQIKLSGEWVKGTDSHKISVTGSKKGLIQQELDSFDYYASQKVMDNAGLKDATGYGFLSLYSRIITKKPKVADVDNRNDLAVKSVLKRYETMALSDGGYSMWPRGSSRAMPESLYAIHFKIDADRYGYTVHKHLFKSDLNFLKRVAFQRLSNQVTPLEQAYAVYLLALIGQPENNLAVSLFNTLQNSALIRTMAAGALVKAGKSQDVMEFLNNVTVDKLAADGAFSDLHAAAMVLPVLLEVYNREELAMAYFDSLLSMRTDSGNSANRIIVDDAMIVYAYSKWAEVYGDSSSTVASVDGGQGVQEIRGDTKTYTFGGSSEGKSVEQLEIASKGPGPVYVNYQTTGVSTEPVCDEFSGIAVKRRFSTDNADDITVFDKGDLITVRLEVTAAEAYSDIVIVDMLPGGFVIEDFASEQEESLFIDLFDDSDDLFGDDDSVVEVITSESNGPHEIRTKHCKALSNTFLLFADLKKGKSYYEYTVRAASKGIFTIPAISAESSDDPNVYGRKQSVGYIKIK